MAKLINLFTFSGRVGDLVGCQGPRGYYVRSRQRKSSKPPTAKQLEARARMARVMDFLTPLREIIYVGFDSKSNRGYKTGALSKAISHAMRKAMLGKYPNWYIDPSEIRLSQGDLLPLRIREIVPTGSGVVYVKWNTTQVRRRAFDDDRVFVIAYRYPDKVLVVAENQRSAGEVSVDTSSDCPGSEWLLYACAAERDLSRFSNSQFLGKVRIDG